MREPLIEFRNVAKSFGENHVLNNVNLKIYENEITTIIGKSGTGKSVLLKHIIGLLSPDEGTIYFKGRPINGMKSSEWDECRVQISYMFQNNALFDSMTVFENIALPLRQTTALKDKEVEIKVMSRIDQMDLLNVVNEYPSALSGGMQKRVALARALITDRAIVLFYEPTTGQDPVRKNIILGMIARYRKRFGFTAVLISHDIPDIFFVSDRILILWEGKLDFQGSYEELMQLNHPMMLELKESIDSLSKELNGGGTKEMLKLRYDMSSGQTGKAH
jgi:phospholipid/cholesterol/gamma-HCH transport system ATP-binding protein